MEWRNTKTGAVIDVDSKLSGKWEPVEAPNAPAKKEKTEPVERKKGSKKK